MYLKEQLLEGLSKVESGLIDECKKSNKSNLLIPFIAILNIFVMIVLPLLGLINMLLLTSSLIKSVKIQKSEYEKFIKLKQEIEDIVAKANSIQITLSNNETFTLKRLKELGKKQKKELKISQRCWQDQKNISLNANCSLHKAKELIEELSSSLSVVGECDDEECELLNRAEQFLKDSVE